MFNFITIAVLCFFGMDTSDDGKGTPFILDKKDNICGTDEPRAIQNPAKINYESVLNSTDEMRKIKQRKIDKDSAEGIRLLSLARRKILSACEKVQLAHGYDSMWRAVKRRDKRPIADLTDKVKQQIENRVSLCHI